MTTKLSAPILLLVTVFGFPAVPCAAAKEVAKLTPPDQAFTLTVETVPAATKDDGIVLNKIFAMTVKIVSAGDPAKVPKYTELSFDARMPAHKHGMVVKPKITETAPGEFRIDGAKLHMAGDWELSFGVKAGDAPLRWTVPLAMK